MPLRSKCPPHPPPPPATLLAHQPLALGGSDPESKAKTLGEPHAPANLDTPHPADSSAADPHPNTHKHQEAAGRSLLTEAVAQRQKETDRTKAGKSLQTEDGDQHRKEDEETKARKSLQTEDATQRQGDVKRTKGWKSRQIEDIAQRQEEVETWRAIAEFFLRDSCLQAIAAELLLQGQVRPLDPGPRSSTDTTTAMEAGFPRTAIEQELSKVLKH